MPLSAPELLGESHDVSGFNCGKPMLDEWLKNRALSNQKKGFTVVMVVHDAGRVPAIMGSRQLPLCPQWRRAPSERASLPIPCHVSSSVNWQQTLHGLAAASELDCFAMR